MSRRSFYATTVRSPGVLSNTQAAGSVGEVFRVALRLGLTSFGGPIAHIGYFRREYVERRRWLDETTFADLVVLCQSLPGPASSQLGIAIGTRRAGMLGGVASWLGFTLPSAVALVLLASLAGSVDVSASGWVHGLKLAAVAVVAQAVWSMSRVLAPDWQRRAVAVAAAAIALSWSTPLAQVAIIVGGGVLGVALIRRPVDPPTPATASPISRRVGVAALGLFVVLLFVLPLARSADGQAIALFEAFFRSGALVFGGGHLVLPLMHAGVVPPGWVTPDQFLAGYGAAQAVPGPLFSFAAYLGAVSTVPPGGSVGAIMALAAIFAPSFLLIFGVLPFWERLRTSVGVRAALSGTNAAVVGILAAALYTPIWTGSVSRPPDVVLVAISVAALVVASAPPWLVVLALAVVSQLAQLLLA